MEDDEHIRREIGAKICDVDYAIEASPAGSWLTLRVSRPCQSSTKTIYSPHIPPNASLHLPKTKPSLPKNMPSGHGYLSALTGTHGGWNIDSILA